MMRSFAMLITLIFIVGNEGLKLKLPAGKVAVNFIAPFLLAGNAHAESIAVFGGNGFVGSRVVAELVAHGDKVTSISKSGSRPNIPESVADKVTWLKGDPSTDTIDLKGNDAVISCIGAIGFDDDLVRRVNGDVNVAAVKQASDAGAKRFVYISVSDIVPQALGKTLPAYFEGKSAAEKAVTSTFGGNGVLIKPSFIYGGDAFLLAPPRVPGGYGALVETVLSSSPFRALAAVSPPIVKVALVPPVSVEHIAQAAAAAALGLVDGISFDGADDINGAAKLMGHF